MKKKKNIIDELSVKMLSLENMPLEEKENEIMQAIGELSDINMTGRDGRTLLIHASCYNQISIIQHLLNANADLNKHDDLGFTALHAAVEHNHYDIAKILLEAGADVNATDQFGNTPLRRAGHQNTDIIKLLLSAGADPTIANNFGMSAFSSFAAYPHIIKMFEDVG